MKHARILVLSSVLIFVGVFATSAFAAKGRKQINIIGALGLATSGIDDPIFDVGVEVELVRHLFVRFMLNSHLGDSRNYYDYYPTYYYGQGHGTYWGVGYNDGTVLHGLTAGGVFKAAVSKKIKLFFQASLNYMSYTRYDYQTDDQKWQGTRQSGYGAGFGSGLEFYLGERFGLMAGGTYRLLFEEQSQQLPNTPRPDKPDWLEIYVGFYYRLKGR
jgi:hypothetical protein